MNYEFEDGEESENGVSTYFDKWDEITSDAEE